MDSIAVILNPAAGRGRAGKLWPKWHDVLESRIGSCEVFETLAPRMATRLVREALDKGHTRIISAGGDGTHFEVVNGCIADSVAINPAASVAYLPLGSGADFTRSLEIGREFGPLADSLARWDARPIDLIQVRIQGVSGKPESFVFQNIARAGAGGEVVARAEASRKPFGGFATFLLATLQTVLTYRHKALHLEYDETHIDQRFLELVVANGRYDGGGMKSAPHAELDDGLIDMYVYGHIKLLDALMNLHKIYTGNMMDRPEVVRYAQARSIKASSNDKVLVEADGEVLGYLPATFTLLPSVLRVVHG